MVKNKANEFINEVKDVTAGISENLNSNDNVQNIKKGADMIREGLEKSAYELGSKVKEEVNKSQDYAKNGLHYIEDQAKGHPFLTIGVSFLLGLFASRLTSSK